MLPRLSAAEAEYWSIAAQTEKFSEEYDVQLAPNMQRISGVSPGAAGRDPRVPAPRYSEQLGEELH